MYQTITKNLRTYALLYVAITLSSILVFMTSKTMATVLEIRSHQLYTYKSSAATKDQNSLTKVQVPSMNTTYLAESPEYSYVAGTLTKPITSSVPAETTIVETTVPSEVQASIAEAIQSSTEMVEEPELVMYYTEDDVIILAKVIQVEAGGISSFAERAAVGWCILNRVDYEGNAYSFPSTIAGCATQSGQFAYYPGTQYTDENYWIAADVLERWNLEQNGYTDVGRTLPSEYLFFSGDGSHNHFRTDIGYGNGSYDWSLGSPYEEDN